MAGGRAAVSASSGDRWRALARLAQCALLALALTMLMTGCKSFYPVDIHTADGLQVIAPGEFVRVTTFGAEKREFEVTAVDARHIAGHTASYTSEQIQAVERHEYDIAKSLAFGTGVHVTVAIVAAIVLASAAGAAIF